MSHCLLSKVIKGFKNGVFIGLICAVAMSFLYVGNAFVPYPPSFIANYSNELVGFIVAVIGWGIIGITFVLTTLIFTHTDWSITKATIVHALISYLLLLPIALFLRWIDFISRELVTFTIIYIIVYGIIWGISMVKTKREIKNINTKLN